MGHAPAPAVDTAGFRPGVEDVDVAALSHVGYRRTENQDQFIVASMHKLVRVRHSSLTPDELTALETDSRGFVLIVADGAGGIRGGAAASRTAVRSALEYVTHMTGLYFQLQPEDDLVFLRQLERAVLQGHHDIRAAAREDDVAAGATTLTLVAVVWPRAYLVHVGDSRCYRLRDGQLELMSHDQTLAQDLVDCGALTEAQAAHSPFRHQLTSALGSAETTLLTASSDCRWDDVLLLCTDGLTKHVTDDEIADTLRREPTAADACRSLVELALERGGEDNVTVVVGKLRK